MSSLTERDLFEIEEKTGKLNPAQHEYVFSPEPLKAFEGGYGSGKSYAACVAGLILSAAYPGNAGMMARYAETDLQDSIVPLFMDEVCPPSWIQKYHRARPQHVVLRNGSRILFRHVHDARAKGTGIGTKSRRAGANLGWFFISQAEEIEISHFNAFLGRLRRAGVKKRFAFLDANPNGHDWIFKMFFEHAYRLFNPGEDWLICRRGQRLGIYARSEINARSHGGFVDDESFALWRETMAPEFVARYMDCSFEAFTGQIYKSYSLDSVHNIEEFVIPDDWPTVVSVDVGGDCPWHVGVHRFDMMGNCITTDEFHKPTVNSAEVAFWIKNHVNVADPRITYIIDPENKLAMLELNQALRVAFRIAQKAVRAGIIRVGGYMHVNPAVPLPPWYEDSQPSQLVTRFAGKGSPRMFVFYKRCPNWCREHHAYIWDSNRPGHPVKENDHAPDETRYCLMTRPDAARLPKIVTRRDLMRLADPLSARAADSIDRRIRAIREVQSGSSRLIELMHDEVENPANNPLLEAEAMMTGQTTYDWND